MGPLKKLKKSHESQPISWRDPQFSDWKLLLTSDAETQKVFDVHRCVIASGRRHSRFLEADVSRWHQGSAGDQSTELGRLLPQACYEHVEEFLDHMYGVVLKKPTPEGAAALLKIADAMQCPTLHNAVIDQLNKEELDGGGEVEALIRHAWALGLTKFVEDLIEELPKNTIFNLDLDLINITNVDLALAVAKRALREQASKSSSKWKEFLGNGQITSKGALKISLVQGSVGPSPYWVWATGGEVKPGDTSRIQTASWTLRVDQLPGDNRGWTLCVGVVSGKRDWKLAQARTDANMYSITHRTGFMGVTTWSPIPGRVSTRLDVGTAGNWQRASADAQQPNGPDGPGFKTDDTIVVALTFPENIGDEEAQGTLTWSCNGIVYLSIQDKIKPGPVRLCAELSRNGFEPDSMSLTLLSSNVTKIKN